MNAPNEVETASDGKLLKILGVTFGIAITVGGMIGLGILRTPGTVAAQLGSSWLILVVWIIGGVYALMGVLQVAELGTSVPRAGGLKVRPHAQVVLCPVRSRICACFR